MASIRVEELGKDFITPLPGAQKRRFPMSLFQKTETTHVAAVKGISFDIAQGERVAFIGPNGAGKSTTLKILTGILYPTRGDANVLGYVPWKQRRELAREIGIVFGQRSQLWNHLPAQDSYDLLARIYDLSHADYRRNMDELVETFRIAHLLDKPVRNMSLGQRMRCEIAASLLHGPKILFLDEPTIGLDVTAKALLRDHLRALSDRQDITIMLTSHDTGDIEEIAERVIIINYGKILLDLPLEKLRSEYMRSKFVTVVTAEKDPALDMNGVEVMERSPHQLKLGVDLDAVTLDKVITKALKTLDVRDLGIENAPLEDIIRDIYGDEDA